MIPGEYFLLPDDIIANAGRDVITIHVVNTGDRPVQVGSHFHFFEVNKQLLFDRRSAFGKRLNIASGTAVRFEPGEEKEVSLVQIGGNKIITGFSNLVNGDLSPANEEAAMKKLTEKGFKNTGA